MPGKIFNPRDVIKVRRATGSTTIPTRALVTQAALEQFLTTNPPAQVTQVTVEQWVTTATVAGQAIVTQVALEQWTPVAPPFVDLTGNLGGPSQYGRFYWGLKRYSRADAFAPMFSADLTVFGVIALSGGLVPVVSLTANLDVHVSLLNLAGDVAPQIVLAASSLIAEPLWASSESCPPSAWSPSESCPSPAWTPVSPPLWAVPSGKWKKQEKGHDVSVWRNAA